MNYFQFLSYSLGSIMIISRFLIELIPKKWKDFELNTAYTQKQPKWVWIVSLIGFLIIGYTWYQHFTANVPYSIIITLFISLTVIKTSQVLFNYKKFRILVVRAFNEDRNKLTKFNILILVMGIVIFCLGLFIY